jgi:hypothetical protein
MIQEEGEGESEEISRKSPMQLLKDEYTLESKEEISIMSMATCQWFINKKTLAQLGIVDRGISTTNPIPWFSL